MSEPHVYIIVLNYCSALDTLECVESIREIKYGNLTLLVIDNASPDGSAEILARTVPENEFLQLAKNTGYAGGNNDGIQKALLNNADYILIVNPDVRLNRDSIKSYVDVFLTNESVGALSPVQLNAAGNAVDPIFLKGVVEGHRINAERLVSGTAEEWDVRTLYGACLMLRASTIKKVGGFDPLYFAYGEETDLCRRILFHGYRLVVTGRSPVRHLRTKATEGFDSHRLFLCLKATYLYKLKNPRGSFRFAMQEVMRDVGLDIFGKRRDQFPAYMRGAGTKHAVKAGLWVLARVGQIWSHRRLEQAGRAHV